ncbi:hypothetical protein V8E51_003184 [Hyaloscypha variabilis]
MQLRAGAWNEADQRQPFVMLCLFSARSRPDGPMNVPQYGRVRGGRVMRDCATTAECTLAQLLPVAPSHSQSQSQSLAQARPGEQPVASPASLPSLPAQLSLFPTLPSPSVAPTHPHSLPQQRLPHSLFFALCLCLSASLPLPSQLYLPALCTRNPSLILCESPQISLWHWPPRLVLSGSLIGPSRPERAQLHAFDSRSDLFQQYLHLVGASSVAIHLC